LHKVPLEFLWNSWDSDGILEFHRNYLGLLNDEKFKLFPPWIF
jgi:hypothetical protein